MVGFTVRSSIGDMTLYYDGGRNPCFSFAGFNGWSEIVRLSGWAPIASAILASLGIPERQGLQVLNKGLGIASKFESHLRLLEEANSSQYYDFGAGMTWDEVEAEIEAFNQRRATQQAKRLYSGVRRQQFCRERPDLILRMIDAGVPYVCAHSECKVQEKLTVDHKIALSRGGTDDVSNLQFMCGPHNSAKGDRDV